MPIIVGVPRSGTTVLRFMLDAHPMLTIPPETGFLVALARLAKAGDCNPHSLFTAITEQPPEAPVWPDFQIPRDAFWQRLRALDNLTPADAARCFYRMYAERHGKPRFGEKTPLYGPHIADIASLLPEARFIHLIRDGRDVALSLRGLWFSPGDDIDTLAGWWRDAVVATRAQARACAHYLEVRYEELIREPRATLERICAFVDLAFDPRMLRYFETASQRLREHGERRDRDGRIIVARATEAAAGADGNAARRNARAALAARHGGAGTQPFCAGRRPSPARARLRDAVIRAAGRPAACGW
jgi:Sulfotransferase family